jgi:hypothetical protein
VSHIEDLPTVRGAVRGDRATSTSSERHETALTKDRSVEKMMAQSATVRPVSLMVMVEVLNFWIFARKVTRYTSPTTEKGVTIMPIIVPQPEDEEDAPPADETRPKYELHPTVREVDVRVKWAENELIDVARDWQFNDMEIERAMKASDDMVGKVQGIQKDKHEYWTLMAGIVGVAATVSVVTGVVKLWHWIQRKRKLKVVEDKPMESESNEVNQGAEGTGGKTRRHARSWDQYQ